MSERRAENLPIQRTKQGRKRKPGDGGEQTAPVVESATNAEQESPPAATPDDAPDARGRESVEGVIGLAGVGVVVAAVAGLSGGSGGSGGAGGSGGGAMVATGDAVAMKPLSPIVTGTSVSVIPDLPVKQPTTSTTTSTATSTTTSTVLVEEATATVPGAHRPGIVESKIEPEVGPTIDPPIQIDTTPPTRPTLALKRDTGADANDGVTNDSTITVSGLEQDATWRYSLDGGKTWHDGRKSEISDIRFDGVHQVQVVQTDRAGNVSEATSFTFTLDTGAPTLSLKNDTARTRYDDASRTHVAVDESHKHDGITRDGTLSVSGLKEGAIWQFSLNEGRSWRAGYGSEISASEMGNDGRKTVWVRQKDEGGESGLSSFSFVLDTHVGELFPRLKSVDSWNRKNRPVTSEPVVVFDGFEEGAVANWLTYGGTPSVVISNDSSLTAEVSFVGKVPPGEVLLSSVSQADIAGNLQREDSFYFVFTPPDAGKPGPMVPLSDSIFP